MGVFLGDKAIVSTLDYLSGLKDIGGGALGVRNISVADLAAQFLAAAGVTMPRQRLGAGYAATVVAGTDSINDAIDYVHRNIDLGRYSATLTCDSRVAGAFNENVVADGPFVGRGTDTGLNLVGFGNDPDNFKIDTSGIGGPCVEVSNGAALGLRYCTLKGGAQGVAAVKGGRVHMTRPKFDTCGSVTTAPQIYSTRHSYVEIFGDYDIIGDAAGSFHILCSHHGNFRWVGASSPTCTLTGTLSYLAFVKSDSQSDITVTTNDASTASYDVSGATVTGRKFLVAPSGYIQWAVPLGGGYDSFPGNIAGLEEIGGVASFSTGIDRPSTVYKTGTRDISLISDWSITDVPFRPARATIIAVVPGTSMMSIGILGLGAAGAIRFNHGAAASTWQTATGHLMSMLVDGSNFTHMTLASRNADGLTLTPNKTGAPTGTLTYHAILSAGGL